MTEKVEESKLFKGIGPTRDSTVTLIQYADNTFFFLKARKRYMTNLKIVWDLFEWASGIRINKEKSELFYMGCKTGRDIRLAGILQCNVGKFPTK